MTCRVMSPLIERLSPTDIWGKSSEGRRAQFRRMAAGSSTIAGAFPRRPEVAILCERGTTCKEVLNSLRAVLNSGIVSGVAVRG
jgi:hypothetical protein